MTAQGGSVTTFYSYKGGTGRTMALANVGWILAANGRRVLLIDWDLEAPGLHRYFAPFLADPALMQTNGLIDWAYDYLVAATEPPKGDERKNANWYEAYAAIDAYARPVEWQFPGNGCVHIVGAGVQGPQYAERVNKFNWNRFYGEYGGKAFVDAALRQAREHYDHILIDSRTGVADTSGICTIQLPDTLVVLFTLNNQSIHGAAEVATHAVALRDLEHRPLRVLPVAARVELAEDDKLKRRQGLARKRFEPLLQVRDPQQYFEMSVLYVPYYAYEEVLATIREPAGASHPMLRAFLAVAKELGGSSVEGLPEISDPKRKQALDAYAGSAEMLGPASQATLRSPSSASDAAKAASEQVWDVFISYPANCARQAAALYRQLAARCKVFLDSRSVPAGALVTETVLSAMKGAKVIVLLIGNGPGGPEYDYEVNYAKARLGNKADPVRVVPVLVGDAELQKDVAWLREYSALRMKTLEDRTTADAILKALGVGPLEQESFRERAVAAEVRLEELAKGVDVQARKNRWLGLVAAFVTMGAGAAAFTTTRARNDAVQNLQTANGKLEEAQRAAKIERETLNAANLTVSVNQLQKSVSVLQFYTDSTTRTVALVDADAGVRGTETASVIDAFSSLDNLRDEVNDNMERTNALKAELAKLDLDPAVKQNLGATLAEQQQTLTGAQTKITSVVSEPVAKPGTTHREKAQIAWRVGYALYNQGKFPEAKAKYEQARAADPDYAPAYNSLGRLELEAKHYDKAEEYFAQAIQKDATYAPAYSNRAFCLAMLGDLRSARESANKALALRPGQVAALRALEIVAAKSRAANDAGL